MSRFQKAQSAYKEIFILQLEMSAYHENKVQQ